MFLIRARETGDTIEVCNTLAEANIVVARYEREDKKDNVFVPNFYEVVNSEADQYENLCGVSDID